MSATVIVDLPRQWTDWASNLLVLSDEVVITAAPDSQQSARRKDAGRLDAQQRGEQANVRLVLNKLDDRQEDPALGEGFSRNPCVWCRSAWCLSNRKYSVSSRITVRFSEKAHGPTRRRRHFRQLATTLGARQSADRSSAAKARCWAG